MNLRDYIFEKKHHIYREDHPDLENLAEEYARLGLCPKERMARRFETLAALSKPVLLPGEKICFLRTVKTLPDCFTKAEWQEIRSKHHIHESGYMSNLCPDYGRVIAKGLLACREEADEYGKRIINAIFDLTDRYRAQALAEGKKELAAVLERVPRYSARSFYEALQFFRILHFSLWLEGDYHNTVGRFDQYMLPYFLRDMEKGLYTKQTALELLEDFFLSFNKDSDLYFGVQQGDNGQSMVLGGIDEKGNDAFNALSELCLQASENLMMIDPKINIRVSKKTPLRIYELGSRLTKVGLGFPQYSNDDVVIPGLLKLGYAPEDVWNYAVAACWEFIIPGVGADIANVSVVSLPDAVNICTSRDLEACEDFDAFMEKVRQQIQVKSDAVSNKVRDLWFVPSPFMHIMMTNGIYDGGKYNNFGIFGIGVATAADSLAAIQKYIYEEKRFTKKQLIEAVESDFEKHGELLPVLRYEAPKVGNNEDAPDAIMAKLLEMFADSLKGKKNCRGGCFRPGTGTAMWYLWGADRTGASADGRRKKEPFGTNYSPSIFPKLRGPLSIIQSFTKPDLSRVINGGPLTLEFASSMFAAEESIQKLACLVKAYIDLGGHQIQLNTVNTALLKAAQADPANYRQLVVRIWGWSAYFVELDKEYQDHVLLRQQYSL